MCRKELIKINLKDLILLFLRYVLHFHSPHSSNVSNLERAGICLKYFIPFVNSRHFPVADSVIFHCGVNECQIKSCSAVREKNKEAKRELLQKLCIDESWILYPEYVSGEEIITNQAHCARRKPRENPLVYVSESSDPLRKQVQCNERN